MLFTDLDRNRDLSLLGMSQPIDLSKKTWSFLIYVTSPSSDYMDILSIYLNTVPMQVETGITRVLGVTISRSEIDELAVFYSHLITKVN